MCSTLHASSTSHARQSSDRGKSKIIPSASAHNLQASHLVEVPPTTGAKAHSAKQSKSNLRIFFCCFETHFRIACSAWNSKQRHDKVREIRCQVGVSLFCGAKTGKAIVKEDHLRPATPPVTCPFQKAELRNRACCCSCCFLNNSSRCCWARSSASRRHCCSRSTRHRLGVVRGVAVVVVVVVVVAEGAACVIT